jgi:hypothetical protein
MNFFSYIRYQVRKLSVWFLASLILLSSGSMQLVLHSCPGSGITLFQDCGMHESENDTQLPDCCKKKYPDATPKNSCGNCEDFFVFSITPKFGSIAEAETGEPPVHTLFQHISQSGEPSLISSARRLQVQRELPPKLKGRLVLHCSWLI